MAYPLHSFTDGDGVPAQPSFPRLEQAVLDYWATDGTFQASVDGRPAGENGSNEFVFYDGPPFANGLPHYGHLLTGYAKDVVPRYQAMRGKHVERRFGWAPLGPPPPGLPKGGGPRYQAMAGNAGGRRFGGDCHGLPAEVRAEKELGISSKAEIEALGVDKFNDACRTSVLRYTDEWRDYVTR